jgi:hypothetical protein
VYLWLFFPKHCTRLQNSGKKKIKKINDVLIQTVHCTS